jgi:hypothetical protein
MYRSILFFAVLAVSAFCTQAQAEVPAICERDGGKFILECAKTCRAACVNADFLTPGNTDACNRVVRLAPEQLVDRAVCGPPKDLCEDQLPDENTSALPAKKPPPDCFKSFPHLTCQADVIKTEFDKISSEFTPLLTKVDISKISETTICNYTKKDLDEIIEASARLRNLYGALNERRGTLHKCINNTNDWVQALRCPVGAPADWCQKLAKAFQDKNKAAADKMTLGNQKAEELTHKIEIVQAGIDYISQVYRYACPRSKK